MNKIVSLLLILCSVLTLYTWVFESAEPASVSTVAYTVDENGMKKDEDGLIIPEYYDDKLSGEFYSAGSKPLELIMSVGTVFDDLRGGIVSVVSSSTSFIDNVVSSINRVTSLVDTVAGYVSNFNSDLSNILGGIFNFDDIGSWWDDLFEGVTDGSRGKR